MAKVEYVKNISWNIFFTNDPEDWFLSIPCALLF